MTGAVAEAIAELRGELAARGLKFPLHFWWSREWFTPDGVPGIAVPFYLAHPRLARLEREHLHHAEGASPAALRKILRHEAGHALMNAYALRGRADVQALFGDSKRAYPRSYRPQPHSRRFVRHLTGGYAQSHPDEDFAETFAVWLGDRAAWRRRYRHWPALEKLEGMDRLMTELAGRRASVRNRRRLEPIELETRTLRQHYGDRRRELRLGPDAAFDRALRGAFAGARCPGAKMTAETFLRRIKEDVARSAARSCGRPRYEADRVVERLIRRSRELGLRVPPRASRDVKERVSDSARRLLEQGHHPIFM